MLKTKAWPRRESNPEPSGLESDALPLRHETAHVNLWFRCIYICGNDLGVQARALGDELVLGLIPDSEILRCKGPPVMSEAERKTMVESVKWVGEVITGKPHFQQ